MQRNTFLSVVTLVALVSALPSPVPEPDQQQQQHQQLSSLVRHRRSIFHLYSIMECTTKCNPKAYNEYGCYCGLGGAGQPVDGLDKCCQGHDLCLTYASRCAGLDYYLQPFRWRCNGGSPYCVPGRGPLRGIDSCSHQKCECDRQFAECIRHFPCPTTKVKCPSEKG